MPRLKKRKAHGNGGGPQNNNKWGGGKGRKCRKLYWVQQQEKQQQQLRQVPNCDVTLVLSRVNLVDHYRVAPISTPKQETEATEAPAEANVEVSTQQSESAPSKNETPPVPNVGDAETGIVPSKDSLHAPVQDPDAAVDHASAETPNLETTTSMVNQVDNATSQEASSSPGAKTEEVTMPARVQVVLHASCQRNQDDSPFAPSPQQQEHQPDLPHGDCGDGILNPHPKQQVPDKYWAQRRRFFTKYDNGIQLDREGWFSVTPEVIANHIAQRMVQAAAPSQLENSPNAPPVIWLDAFCGVGGNAIAMARRAQVDLVVCVDTDPTRLALAAANARVYEIPPNKMIFLQANACRVLQSYANHERKCNGVEKEPPIVPKAEETHMAGYRTGGLELLPDHVNGIFLSPPWGGMDYEALGPRHYDLSCITLQSTDDTSTCWDGQDLLRLAETAAPGHWVYFLPRNTNGLLLAQATHAVQMAVDSDNNKHNKKKLLELEQHYLCAKLKTLAAYGSAYAHSQDSVEDVEEEKEENVFA